MTTKAQVKANKKNAKKSTGPKTNKGKEKSSQNATKHGLFARKTVILNENPEEYDLFQRQMLEDLTPQGAMQLVFAERIIDLAWRLKRCQSIQNQAIDEMIKEKRMNTYYRIIDGGFDDKRNTDDLLVGQAVIRDFRTSQVLERLMKYEQQIEKCLYKNIHELKALQKECHHARRTTQNAPREQNEPNQPSAKVSPPIHSAGSHANMENPQSQGEPKMKNKPNSEKRATTDEPQDTLHASRDANLQNKPNLDENECNCIPDTDLQSQANPDSPVSKNNQLKGPIKPARVQ